MPETLVTLPDSVMAMVLRRAKDLCAIAHVAQACSSLAVIATNVILDITLSGLETPDGREKASMKWKHSGGCNVALEFYQSLLRQWKVQHVNPCYES